MATTAYNEDIGNPPQVFPGETKQRVYDDARDFLINYKAGVGGEKSPGKAINGDPQEVLVSGHFGRIGYESELPSGPSKFTWCGN